MILYFLILVQVVIQNTFGIQNNSLLALLRGKHDKSDKLWGCWVHFVYAICMTFVLVFSMRAFIKKVWQLEVKSVKAVKEIYGKMDCNKRLIKFCTFNLTFELLAIFRSVSWESAMILSLIWINKKLNKVLGAFSNNIGDIAVLFVMMFFCIFVFSNFIREFQQNDGLRYPTDKILVPSPEYGNYDNICQNSMTCF